MNIKFNRKNFIETLKKFIVPRLPLIIFLALFILYAILTYRDYGITWDETDVYTWGKANIDYYLLKPNDYSFNLLKDLEGFYYNLYASVLVAISYLVKHANSFYLFHFLNFVFATPIFILAYEVILKHYKKSYLAILAPIFLVLTPRFFNDIAANPKDVPFAVVLFCATALIYLVFKKDSFTKIIVLGVSFGMAQSFRIIGFDIYIIYAAYILYTYFLDNKFNKNEFVKYLIKEFKILVLIIITAFVFMFATWPAVGANVIGGLKTAIELPKTFQWTGTVLFNGENINFRQLPDQYLPMWYLISNPIFILVLLGTSLIFLKKLIKNKLFFLFGSSFILNLLLYFVLNPVIYNGIRHFLFLYVFGSFIALLTLIELILWIKKTKYKRIGFSIILGLLLINILSVIINYINLYPYGYIYFNEFVGGLNGANNKFEADYWAAASKEAVEWLNRNTPDEGVITISSRSFPNQIKYFMKPNMQYFINQERNSAQYYITGELDTLDLNSGKIIHTIQREGVVLMYIFEFNR